MFFAQYASDGSLLEVDSAEVALPPEKKTPVIMEGISIDENAVKHRAYIWEKNFLKPATVVAD